jgi:DNA-binding NtrC family response regulator
VRGIRPEAMAALCAHPWPGNVRELRNAIERAVVLGRTEWLEEVDLPPQIVARGSAAATTASNASSRRSAPTPPLGSMTIGGGPLPSHQSAPSIALPPLHSGPAITVPAVTIDAPPAGAAASGAPAAARSLRDLERDGIVAALAATGGNKAQAAAILEIDRSTLYKKLKEYGIG